jgi:hypothetical protein
MEAEGRVFPGKPTHNKRAQPHDNQPMNTNTHPIHPIPNGEDEIPPGTFHGEDEIPPGTFHA